MISGLAIFSNFITDDEERALLFEIDGIAAAPRVRIQSDSRTLIVRWGATVYATSLVSPTIPAWLEFVRRRVPMDLPTSVTLNVWAPGDRLDPHIDKGGPVVCVLNLASPSTIAFHGPHVEIYEVPRRGLLRMSGAARRDWEHSCFPASSPRISLVFRTVAPDRSGPDTSGPA